MPGGLAGVEQVFSADASKYVAGIGDMIRANQALIASVAEARRSVGDVSGAPAAASAANDIAKVNAAIREQLKVLGDHSAAIAGVSAASVALARTQADAARVIRDSGTAVRDTSAAFSDLAVRQEKVRAVSTDGSTAARSYAADLGKLRDTARETTNALADAATAVSAVTAAGSGGGGTAGPSLTEIGRMMDQRAASAGFASYRDAIAAAGLGPSGGGGGGGGGDILAALGGGGGGGGGSPFSLGGSAGRQADTIVGFVKRWWAPVHWAMMATNEILATAGPAVAAAGAAAMVGWQGVEQMRGRFQAITATAESLGPAFGQTAGSYLGTGSQLQHFQNLATGGVYELGGAGINLARSGAGSFGQMGLNTIAMLDRGVAGMQVNMAQRGTMGTLGKLLGGGTDYLRTFGDIGANVGNIFLGLGPHLPGVGGDYLATLKGITGALAGGIGGLNQAGLGNVLGLGLAGEAGARVGTPMVGLLGKLLSSGGRLAGRLPKIGGLSGTDLADISRFTGVNLGVDSLEAGGVGLGGLLTGGGEALGALGGPEVAALAMSAFLGSKLVGSMPSPAERQMAALQAGVNKAGFSGAWQPLGHAITTATGLAATAGGGGPGADMIGASEAPSTFARFGPIGPTARQIYQNAATGFGATMDNLIGAGPQLVSALQKAGLKGVSMGDAFQIAQNSLLDLSHAFDSHGKLTKTSQQMLSNYVSAIGPMTRSGGAFNAAIDAQQIMSSPAMQNLSKVNQAMDSMTQIMSGGPAGMATLFGMLGGTPTRVSHGGMRLQAPPAINAMAKALSSVTTAGGAAAWNTFAGSSGLVAAEQQNLDQLRTAMTLGAVGPGGAAGLAGFQLQQMLPMAKHSSGALAMLMQQGQQMGIGGYYDPSKSLAQNYAAAEKSIGKIADTSKQANAQTNAMTVNLSRLPQVAQQFSQGMNANIMSQDVAKAATAMNAVIGSAGKGAVNTGGISTLIAQMKQAGVTAQAIGPVIQHALQSAGVGAGMQKKIMIAVGANISAAQAAISSLHGKTITVRAMAAGVGAVQGAIDSVHGKSVTIQVTTINTTISRQIGALTPSGTGNIAPMTLVGAGNMRITTGQTGKLIPGYGGGDIVPAMLEPGELVVPKHLVGSVAPVLSGKIPGFAAGGVAGGVMGFETMLNAAFHGDSVRSSLSSLLDSLIGPVISAHAGAISAAGHPGVGTGGGTGGTGPGKTPLPTISQAATQAMQAYQAAAHAGGKQFSVEVLKGLMDGIKNAGPASKAAAAALLNKMQQEMAYAKGTAANMTAGLNFGGMDTTQGPVQTQMQSYAASLKAFSADIKSMTKGGLNKDLLKQMIAAGPVQGDALAQSISQGPGGIGAVNKLYASIQHLSKGIGAQAAGAVYGGTIAPNMRSGTIVNNNVSVSISMGGGGGGDLGSLDPKQLKSLMEQIQRELLKQAHRNRKTGTTVKGKGA